MYKSVTFGLLLIAGLMMSAQVWAFGRVEAVVGKSFAINTDGQTRALAQGERVEAGDTLVTEGQAELLIVTDDQGLLALRDNSRLVLEAYRAKGNAQDVLAIKLLKGALRSVTGFIGTSAPKNYRLTTTTATIGIRGTDYEAALIEAGLQAGTYSRVNTGEIAMTNRGITINVQAKQIGYSPTNAVPQLLDAPPDGVFGSASLDAKLEALQKQMAPETESRLQDKQKEQRYAAGATPSGEARVPASCALDTPAQKGLDEFFRAYEAGNIALIQRRLDPAMIGYGAFINNMMEDINNQKQTRFLIQDRTAQCGPDLTVISFRWEKRFLDLVTFKPVLVTGRASVLTYLKGNEWRLSGITGDNPFATSLSTEAATLTAIPPNASFASLPQSCVPGPTSTLTGVATATVPLLSGPPLNPSCTQFTVPSCSIAGNVGTVTSTSLSCSGLPPTATVYSATGSVPFSSTGPASSTALVSQVIPVSGNNGAETATGTVTCQAVINYPTGAPVCGVAPGLIAVQLTLKSGNQARGGSAQVEALASNGDREVFVLAESTPGTFIINGIPVAGGRPTRGDGRINLTGPVTLTLRFLDPKTGALSAVQFNIR